MKHIYSNKNTNAYPKGGVGELNMQERKSRKAIRGGVQSTAGTFKGRKFANITNLLKNNIRSEIRRHIPIANT